MTPKEQFYKRRYQNDVRFHTLVNSFRVYLRDSVFSVDDIQDAAWLANRLLASEVLERRIRALLHKPQPGDPNNGREA